MHENAGTGGGDAGEGQERERNEGTENVRYRARARPIDKLSQARASIFYILMRIRVFSARARARLPYIDFMRDISRYKIITAHSFRKGSARRV